MTEWDELIGHPAWRKLVESQLEKRRDLVERLIVLAGESSDVRVVRVARDILMIDLLLKYPEEERDAGDSN